MRRRDFIAGLGGAAVVGPRGAWGQQTDRMRRIGVLISVRENDLEGQVRVAAFEVDHTRRHQRLRVRDHVSVRIRGAFGGEHEVTCVIPGHDRDGEELVADELVLEDSALAFTYSGVCGYGATFDYAG